ncbi:MAG: carboxypeptidase-like regulatory domain-containing protein [Bacteroidia bacterium]|nr:carboxypeptidase-like regulatory domain-containing protein [Bacteroidia bacterium]
MIIANKHTEMIDELSSLLPWRSGLMPKFLSIVLFVSLLFVGGHSYSQGKILLTIIDGESNLPIPDAKVDIFKAGKLVRSAVTSENGKITIEITDVDEMDLVVSKAGYNKLMICELQIKNKKKAEVFGALSKGSALQYAKGSYLLKQKKKVMKTSKRAFARF